MTNTDLSDNINHPYMSEKNIKQVPNNHVALEHPNKIKMISSENKFSARVTEDFNTVIMACYLVSLTPI